MKAFVKKYLYPLKKEGINITEENDVDMLISAGTLSNYMFRYSNKENTPQILLWMGIAENILGKKNIFYSSPTTTLKIVLRSFLPLHMQKIVIMNIKILSTFGTPVQAGTNIPDSLKKSLKDLNKFVK